MHKLISIYNALFNAYGPQLWWPTISKNKSFEIMIGAILTQNTAWTNVEMAIENLDKEDLIDPNAIINVNVTKLAKLIKPSGYFNLKAKKLKAFAEFYEANFESDFNNMRKVPISDLREQLLSVWGIGDETADSILLYSIDLPSFVIDAYTKRIFSRIGLVSSTDTYMELKKYFEDNLPKNSQMYNEYHALIVEHGKNTCKPRPLCEHCPIIALCDYTKSIK